MNLDDLRRQIDSLDSDIIRLLNERINVVLQIGEEKKKSAQVGLAAGAANLGADHPVPLIHHARHAVLGDGLVEARPARAGVELVE